MAGMGQKLGMRKRRRKKWIAISMCDPAIGFDLMKESYICTNVEIIIVY